MGDGSTVVRVTVEDGSTHDFKSESAISKERGTNYEVINDFFGGKAFVRHFEPNTQEGWSASINLTLTETVKIPGKSQGQKAKDDAQRSAKPTAKKPNFDQVGTAAKVVNAQQSAPPKPKAKAPSLDDVPW